MTSTFKALAKLALISVVGGVNAEPQSYSVLSTTACQQHYDEVGVLSVNSDFVEKASAQARKFVSPTQGYGPAVRTLMVVPDRGSLTAPEPDPSPTYREWRSLFLAPEKRVFVEAFVVGDSASLRISDGAGGRKDTILFGSDPLHGRVGDWDFDVVRFFFLGRSESTSREERAASACNGEVFIRTPAPLNETSASEIARAALEKLSAAMAVVAIRNDDWFYGWDRASRVPHRSNMADSGALPPTTQESYDKLPQYMCFAKKTAAMRCYRAEGDTLRKSRNPSAKRSQ